MEVHLLNSDFEFVAILDTFTSLIWTDRYWRCGDFDISHTPTDLVTDDFDSVRYLRLKESPHLMILEYYNLHSEVEKGPSLILKGRSLEALLDRRIVWVPTDITGDFQDGIEQLLNENVITPTDSDRTIPDFVFLASTDPKILGLGMDNQFDGENLLDLISTLCQSKNVGFRVFLNSQEKFEFQLYAGEDRSYDQTDNPYVIFSPDFDNLLDSDYVVTNQFFKSVALVAGEKGVGNVKTTVSVDALTGIKTGIERREAYISSGIGRNTPEGVLTEEEYLERLRNHGLDELAKRVFVEMFDGEAASAKYAYGEDYFMGDILQVADSYGHRTKSRITEMIYSEDLNGIKMFPAFSKLVEGAVLLGEDVITPPPVVEAPTLTSP